MLNGRRLVIDTMSEVYDLLRPWANEEFWDFGSVELVPNSIYIICRQQFIDHIDRIKLMLDDPQYTVVFDNAAEGSWTLVGQLHKLHLEDSAISGKLLIIGGGDMDDRYRYIRWDHFLSEILHYEENIQALGQSDLIFEKREKPYKFLFLNGRARPHRKYIYERLKEIGLLDQSLWTMLESRPCIVRGLKLQRGDINLMATTTPLRWLPPEYEVSRYRNTNVNPGPLTRAFVKPELFDNTWGEIYLEPAPYIDTYFSLITETVYEYPYSFRTEKIAKPLLMGHPWIVVANQGWYRDIRNLGFKTFSHVIDESFDNIENHQDRIERVIAVVDDLCRQNLPTFLDACRDTVKYNQQHLQELMPKLRSEFPNQFEEFIKKWMT